MTKQIIVSAYKNSWKINEDNLVQLFDNKALAINTARKRAIKSRKVLIVQNKDGKVSKVGLYSRNLNSIKVSSAPVNRNFSNQKVRNSIAQVMVSSH